MIVVVLTSILSTVFESDSLGVNRTLWISVVTILGFLPLSLLKNVSSLEWTSFLSIILSVIFVVFVGIRCFVPSWNDDPIVYFNWSPKIFQGLGIVIFAFECSSNLIPITVELGKFNTPKHISHVVLSSTVISCTIYIAVGIFGYLTFHSLTDGNILNNYPPTDPLMIAMRSLLLLMIIFTYPLALYPCRVSLDRLIFPHLPPFVGSSSPSTLLNPSSGDIPLSVRNSTLSDLHSPSSTPLLSSSEPLTLYHTTSVSHSRSRSSSLAEPSASPLDPAPISLSFGDAHPSSISPSTLTGDSFPISSPSCSDFDSPSFRSPDFVSSAQDLPFEDSSTIPIDSTVVRFRWFSIEKETLRFLGITLLLLIPAYIISIFIPSVDIVFSLIGSTASACLGYIFPALLWFFNRHSLRSIASSPLAYRVNVIGTPILFFLGIIFGILGTVMNIIELF